MRFYKTSEKLNDLRRLRMVASVVFETGGGILVNKMRLKYLVPVSCRIRCLFTPRPKELCLVQIRHTGYQLSPEVLPEALEKLGPAFIKLGQVHSLRADLVGQDVASGLSKLQSDVAPFAYEEVRRIIKEELGDDPERVFKSFETWPVAAASLAQVHRAWLMDGTEVAVKVQRPGIEEVIRLDIRILTRLARLAERRLPQTRPYRPLKVVNEFADWTIRELDFAAEGRNADRFRAMFKDNEHVHIPEIHWQLTTKRVLTMEFVHGVKADDLAGMKELGVNAKALAMYGVDSLLQQFLVEGFFHADPHPGNFFAMRGDVLCLHDFGMVGYLDREQRRELISCFVAFVEKDSDSFFKHFMHLAVVSDQSDVPGFKKDVFSVLDEFFYSPNQPSVARMFFRVINKGATHNITFPADLALFGKALVTTEAMGLKLYPRFNLNEELRPFIKKILRTQLDPRKAAGSLKAGMFDNLELLQSLPDRAASLLQKVDRGEISIRLDATELREFKQEFDRQNDIRILGLFAAIMFLATLVLSYTEGIRAVAGIPLAHIGLAVTVILMIGLIIKLLKEP